MGTEGHTLSRRNVFYTCLLTATARSLYKLMIDVTTHLGCYKCIGMDELSWATASRAAHLYSRGNCQPVMDIYKLLATAVGNHLQKLAPSWALCVHMHGSWFVCTQFFHC